MTVYTEKYNEVFFVTGNEEKLLFTMNSLIICAQDKLLFLWKAQMPRSLGDQVDYSSFTTLFPSLCYTITFQSSWDVGK